MMLGIVLYGPPASGKSSIAEALEKLSPRYVRFRRLKAGGGRTAEYRSTTIQSLDALDASGDIIWRNDRYGATYAVDRAAILAQLTQAVPIVQLGQSEAITALKAATPAAGWYIVALTCSRQVAARRMTTRGDINLTERLSAWDETEWIMHTSVTIDTDASTPGDIATRIDQALKTMMGEVPRVSRGSWNLSDGPV